MNRPTRSVARQAPFGVVAPQMLGQQFAMPAMAGASPCYIWGHHCEQDCRDHPATCDQSPWHAEEGV